MKDSDFRSCVTMQGVLFPTIGGSKEKLASVPANPVSAIAAMDQALMKRGFKFGQELARKRANPAPKSHVSVAIDSTRRDVATNFNASYAFPRRALPRHPP